ncbi:MAG TPA: hemolysin family protein [Nocardioidaceae bacterium]|nr:hemolysin family protein [Nocardioidaceae bacterium]
MSGGGALLVAAALLAMNAFFVGAEFALVSARRTQIEPRAASGSRLARTALRAMEQVSLVMAAAQLGITLCSLALGAVAEPALAHLIEDLPLGLPEHLVHPVAFVIALAIVVYLHVVVGEMVPKNIALAGPDRVALLLATPMMVLVAVLKPVVVALNAIANACLRLLRIEPRDEVSTAYTAQEVADMAADSRREGLLDASSYDLLAQALGFTAREVRRILLPVDELVTLPAGSPLSAVEDACAETGFSRFPVALPDGGLTGYIHVKDILETPPERRPDANLDKWVRPLATVRPSTTLNTALTALRAKGAHLARVVRDDGTLLGVVALEDVIEELVGEIRDATSAQPSGASQPAVG